MGSDDDMFVNDSQVTEKAYKEYKLSDLEEHNLKDIENSLSKGLINSSNKDDMLDYLEDFKDKLIKVKEAEYQYEGEDNNNINRAIKRVMKLIAAIEKVWFWELLVQVAKKSDQVEIIRK